MAHHNARPTRSASATAPRSVLAGAFFALTVAAMWPGVTHAQTPATKKPTATNKTAAKPSAKSSPTKRVAPAAAATAVAAPLVADVPLTDSELAVAAQVHVGALPCELGKVVHMERDATTAGMFRLHMDQQRYRLRPVESRTGAVRLEDAHQGVVWIQLANKSMLMSQKLGRRLADECAGESQQQVAAALKLNPAPSLLDPLPATPTPPAVLATDCRRPLNTTSLPSGVEPC